LALAIFQGIMVPAAGVLVSLWLGLGGIVYVGLLARRARVFDASRQAQDPYLVQLRGRSPLVLVPIANPASAEAMVAVANALAPARVGRVLLLSVVTQPDKWEPGKPPRSLVAVERSAERGLKRIALDEVPGPASAEIVKTDDVASEISRRALENDLVILGLQRSGRRRKFFGELTLQIARSTNCGIIMIGRRD
jgi:nucleotide-binding universal stress UspA family protein